jgi:hypothetical protein
MTPIVTRQVEALRAQAVALAGQPRDLVQRASVYHHLYRHSGGNHVFPLLAAHGALWAGGYFRRNLALGMWATRALSLLGLDGAARFAQLETLADTFRDINRRVCVETWFLYHITADDDLASAAEAFAPPALHAALLRCHDARRAGRMLASSERRALFDAFFRREQGAIVGPAVAQAFSRFDWTPARHVALRPRIAFAYLPAPLAFSDFADTAERMAKGHAAYDAGEHAGWQSVETSLQDYCIMPRAFVEDSVAFFGAMRRGIIGAAA